MSWNNRYIKIAGIVDSIDQAAGKPITREYLMNLMMTDLKEYGKFLNNIKDAIRRSNKDANEEVIEKMTKAVVAKLFGRSEKDIHKMKSEKEKANRVNPHIVEKNIFNNKVMKDNDESLIKIRDRFPHLPKDIPIATPIKSMANSSDEKSCALKKISSTNVKSIHKDHIANGKLCLCNGKIARVYECFDGDFDNELAVIRYIDSGKTEIASLDWKP